MKKISYLMMIALGAYAMQGCNSNKASSATTDSVNHSTDTTKTTIDTTKATTTTTTTTTDSSDVKFAKTVAAAGTAEITFSKLAEQKVKDGKLKNFAEMMVTDHTKAADSLMAIAQKENIMLPTGMDADHQARYNDLQKMSGSDFIKGYVNLMVADHQGAVSLLQNESQNGKDPALKAFATKVLPTVQMHLDAANKLQAGMK